MDVLVGSTSAATASCLFLNQSGVGGSGIGVCGGGSEKEDSLSSSSSSSIGAPDDSDDENESKQGSGDVTDSEEVESKFKGGGGGGRGLTSLGSMGCLEDSLPIKRGLSNYFSGKSKSFASLADVVTSAATVKELEKRENPFNKRRRVLIASKWSRMSSSTSSSSSFYNHPNPKSMPLLALNEHEDEDEDEEQEPEETQEDPSPDQSSSDEKEPHMIRTPKLLDRGLKSFKSRSCYCLSDLQQHKQ